MMTKLFGFILLIVFSPIFFIVGIIIIIDDGFPILFKQKRIGYDNTEFMLFKFRSMKKHTSDIPTHLIDDNDSLYISSGKILRKYSIDEIPQLINIIKGEMVFIGPRPALFNQADLIKLRKNNGIHRLLPGITGWAQINGRDLLSINEKVKFDKYYLDNESFILDIKILLITIFQVFSPKGVSQ